MTAVGPEGPSHKYCGIPTMVVCDDGIRLAAERLGT